METDILALADVPAPLLAALRRLPGTRAPAWIVFEEDVYETSFGDGRFLYPRAAFLDAPAARACLDDLRRKDSARPKDTTGMRYTLKQVGLVRDEAHDQLLLEFVPGPDERLSLRDLVKRLSTP